MEVAGLETVPRLVGPAPARDMRLAGLLIPAVFFSSPETPDFSIELTDSRARCEGVVVVVVAVLAGRLALVGAPTSRAAGLFKVVPADRAVVDAVGLVAVEGAFAGVAFVATPGGLFGGTLVFEAGFAGDLFSNGLDMLGSRSSTGGVCC